MLNVFRSLFRRAGRGGFFGASGAVPARAFAVRPQNPPASLPSFQAFRFLPEVKGFLEAKNIQTPSPIQQLSFSYFLGSQHRDKPPVFIGGPTGSGKTLAYLLPAIDALKRIEKTNDEFGCLPNRPSVIVLAPSKELVNQIFTVAKGISHHAKLKVERVETSANWKVTKKALEEGVDVLVTNSNKLFRLLKEGRISLTNLRYLIIDEADVFLETGDEPDLTRILRNVYLGRETDERVQLLFVSATLTPKLRIYLDTLFDRKAKFLMTSDTHFNLANLTHQFVPVQNKDRLEMLVGELESFRKHPQGFFFLVFCNSMKAVRAVTYALKARGLNASSLHSDMPLRLRAETHEDFRAKKINIMVCTDLVARGLDFTHLTGVLNFDCPKNVNDYIHRAGRAGRIGNVGTVVSFYKNEDLPLIDRLRQSSEKGIPLELTHSSFALSKRKESSSQVPARQPPAKSNVPESYRKFANASSSPVFAPKKTRTKSIAGKRAPQFARRKIIDIKGSIKRQSKINPGSKRVKYLKAATRRLHKQELVRKGKLVLPPHIIKRINRQKHKRS